MTSSGQSSLNRLPIVEVPCPFDDESQRIVRYECSCGMPQPLSRIYFCRYCLDIRCGFCVSHEVDSHYCPNCFQTMPSAEARLKKHRCANCFDCPVCCHTLSTRATTTQAASAEDPSKLISKKVYYLACSFCRWTTRDIGLPDQNVASGGWLEPDNPAVARFSILQDHYRTLAQKEKLEKETRRFVGRKLSYMQLSDKYGMSAAVARKRAGLPPLGPVRPTPGSGASSLGPSSIMEDGTKDQMLPSEPVLINEIEAAPWDDLFESSSASNLYGVVSLDQRLAQIDLEDNLYPRHKHLMVKRSQRCRQCEHNLIKPEYNPASFKFKIQMAAYYHIPEVRIMKLPAKETLQPGKKIDFVLKIINPSQHTTFIEILDLESAMRIVKPRREASLQMEGANQGDNKELDNADKSMVSSTLIRQPLIIKASPNHQVIPNAVFSVPRVDGSHGSKILLPARDDAAEYDDSAGNAELKGLVDDKNVVIWRKGNKVALALSARLPTTHSSQVEAEAEKEDVIIGFGLTFVFTNTVTAAEQREIQKVDVTLPVFVVLGQM